MQVTDEMVERPQLYLDCDGVLADFDRAFAEAFGHPPRVYEERRGSKVFWRNIREEAKDFYRHLPLMEGARELYAAVAHLRPIILTGCPLGGWAEMQKIEWAREHFPGVPLIPCMSKDKRLYCRPGDALVDDYLKYRDLWEAAGGTFIHHIDVGSSIKAIADWNKAALTAALSKAEPPISTRNEEAGFTEFVNEDVPYIVREIDGPVAILLEMETRRIIGYRVFDALSKAEEPAVKVKPGWRMVPERITSEMEDAHFRAHAEAQTVFAEPQSVWAYMLAAAPVAPSEKDAFSTQQGGDRDA